jgi:hypothetical protein
MLCSFTVSALYCNMLDLHCKTQQNESGSEGKFLGTMQVKEFDVRKSDTARDFGCLLEQYKKLEQKLFDAESRAAVGILQRAATAAHKQLHARIEGTCTSILESSHLQLTEVVNALELYATALNFCDTSLPRQD